MVTRKKLMITDDIKTSISTTSPSDTKVPSEKAVTEFIGSAYVNPGTGLARSGLTINHSNSVTPLPTKTAGKIAYDSEGHIIDFEQKSWVDTNATLNSVYVTDSTKVVKYTSDTDASAIVQRESNSQIKVPLTPVNTSDAVSKKYVDDAISVLTSVTKVEVVATKPAVPTLNTLYYVGTSNPYALWLYAKDSTGTPAWRDLGTTELDMSTFVKVADIIDHLNSDATNQPLSAKQGKVLNTNKVEVGNVTNAKLWKGTQAQYDAISPHDASTIYMITDNEPGKEIDMFDRIFPVGSVYISMNLTLPATFNGTWERLNNGCFLMNTTGYPTPGSTGGHSTVTLTEGNMPSHNHNFSNCTTSSAGGHTHSVGTYSIYGYINSVVCKTKHDGGGRPTTYGAVFYDYQGKAEVGGSTYQYGTVVVSANSSTGFEGDSAWNGEHTHTVSGSTDYKGSGYAFDITPPYTAVSMWRRVA